MKLTIEEKEVLVDVITRAIKRNQGNIRYTIDSYHHEVDMGSEARIEKYKKENEILTKIKNKL